MGRPGAGGRRPRRGRPLSRLLAALARSSHPEPVVLVTALMGLLDLSVGRAWGSLWMAAAVLSGQLMIGWSNDYLDRELDRAASRTDKPVARGAIAPRTVRNAAIAAGAACVPLSLASGVPSALSHFAALGAGLAYNAGLRARPVSVLCYTLAFGLLPAVVTLGPPQHRWPHAWALAAGALIGAGGHFAQVLPDIASDRERGLRGLPQLLGERASAALAAGLMLAATAAVTFGPGRPVPLQWAALAISAALCAAILAVVAAERPRTAFRLALAAVAVAVLAFLAGGRSL